MTYDGLFKDESPASSVPASPPDDENPALIDARQAFHITVISAVLFCLASLFILLRTRMG
jgi:hypothetical protein